MKYLFWFVYAVVLIGGIIGFTFIKNIVVFHLLTAFLWGGWSFQMFTSLNILMFDERF